MEGSQQQPCGAALRKLELPRDILEGPNWTHLERAFDDLKERDAASLNLRASVEGSWLDTQALPSVPFSQASRAAAMENQGSGEFCSQVGSPASYSSGSSDRTSSGLVDGAEDMPLAYLMDGNVRAMLKKVTVNEAVLNRAIQSLGGGEKGLKGLMGYIMLWVKEQAGGKFSLPQKLEQLQQQQQQQQQQQPALPPNSPLDFASWASAYGTATSSPMLAGPCGDAARPSHQCNDKFRPLSGMAQSLLAEAPQGVQDLQHPLQRFKTRRLMGEGEADGNEFRPETGFCPSSFMSVATMPGQYPAKLEMGTAVPVPPQVKCEDGTHQSASGFQSGLAFAIGNHGCCGGGDVLSPAATTRAARKNRMARQRQATMHHVRTASQAIGVSPGSGAWSAPPPAAASAGARKAGAPHPGTQASAGGAATRGGKGRNMDLLTLLLQKELRPSDVGNLGRIILPKKEAELHMPFLAMRGGLAMQMEDFDSDICWNLRYSVALPPKVSPSPLSEPPTSLFWPNNKSRMYLLENTGDFVKLHHLEEGDLLILYRNQQGNFVLRGKKKKARADGGTTAQVKSAHSLAKVFPEEVMPKVEGLLTERLYGGGPLERGTKEEPANLDDDPFLKDMMHSMGSTFGSEGLLQPLERFPSLNLDFPLDEMLAVVPKTEPAG